MADRYVGIVVVGEKVTVVDAEIPGDPQEPVVILSDTTWSLQSGDKAPALALLYRRCADYLREHRIERVIIKASALPMGGGVKLALLSSAEVRGVIMAAAASTSIPVDIYSKAVISRNYGDRKVDEYLKDDEFWSTRLSGEQPRKSSREAAMLILAARAR